MQFKKILMAVAAAAVLSVAGVSAADAAPYHGGYGYHDAHGDRRDLREDRRMVDRRVVFDTLRLRHVRYDGDPYFMGGHYGVRSYDRFGNAGFVEIDPYTGGFIGFIRL